MERVKITYAIDLEEVPIEANKLSEESVHWAHVLLEDLTCLNFSMPLPELTEKVHSIRQCLARIDQRVDDCYAITACYHQALSQNFHPQEEHGIPAEQAAQVGELTEKIQELQKAMAATGSNGNDKG